ncbi:MAG: divalent-cation tolerance protein CutA [Candidatus Levybacteria bacterium]|nr:divalent-cation tolerance protein CutA [Candidatus Levybacteria bacterium]
MRMAIYFLTCQGNFEAEKISKALLEKRLIACAKRLPVSSSFWWNNHIDNAKEVVVLLESIEENFAKIEKEVKKLSSYEVPMLFSVKVSKTTKIVEKWLKEELRK